MGHYSLVILAAGKGTRMKSKKQKVLHEIAGKSMIDHLLDSVRPLPLEEKIMIVGYQGDQLRAKFKDTQVTFALQKNQLGTGHALLRAKELLTSTGGSLLILPSDVPLVRTEVLSQFVHFHENNEFKVSILSTEFDAPTGYGRVIRDNSGKVLKIVEEKDAKAHEKDIQEINTGIYCFENDDLLWNFLELLSPENEQGEFYLTEVISIYKEKGFDIGVLTIEEGKNLKGINTRQELAEAEGIFRQRKVKELMESGVTVTDPATTYIDEDTRIGMDTIILPNTHIKGKTTVGEDCLIGPQSFLADSTVESSTVIRYSVVEKSRIRSDCQVGPFSHLRPGADIGPRVSVGNFVEVKKSRLKEGTKANHLTYIGDSQIGRKVNVGAGTITCNFDGKRKHKTHIDQGSFIGSNASLVAPIKIGKNTVVGAGSTLTKDVPDRALAVARQRQVNIKNWKRRGETRDDG